MSVLEEQEVTKRIGRKLLLECLLKVNWDDCTVHGGLLGIPSRDFTSEVIKAAREMKEAGISWEEWT